jgi:hypothetical protein
MFWFKNDLSFVQKKNAPNQYHKWPKKRQKKKDRNIDKEQ